MLRKMLVYWKLSFLSSGISAGSTIFENEQTSRWIESSIKLPKLGSWSCQYQVADLELYYIFKTVDEHVNRGGVSNKWNSCYRLKFLDTMQAWDVFLFFLIWSTRTCNSFFLCTRRVVVFSRLLVVSNLGEEGLDRRDQTIIQRRLRFASSQILLLSFMFSPFITGSVPMYFSIPPLKLS